MKQTRKPHYSTTTDKVPFQLWLEVDELEQLRETARRERRSMSAQLRHLIAKAADVEEAAA